MKSFFRKLQDRGATYEPLIDVRISRAALLFNVDVFSRTVSPQKIAPVLKSNAYGHGLLEVARVLEGHPDVAFFVVDSLYEARVLRTEGVSTPLLVLGYTRSKNILNSPFADVAFSVGSVEQLAELSGAADTDITLHIKVDTGMHRQGIAPGELAAAVSACRANAHLAIGGVCSHLADADGSDAAFTQRQIQTWNAFVQEWRKQMPEPKWLHLSATKGVRYKTEIDANVVRLGIGLYGIDPLGEMQELRPALELRTEVTAVRDIAVGESVGYNHTWRATRKTRVATIPAGYFEGVDRGLSNKGFVDVCGVPCPIVGRVSMNMTSADVTDVPDVRVGSPVVVVSADPTRKNSVVSLAALCDTIPYVILVHISPLLRRTVV